MTSNSFYDVREIIAQSSSHEHRKQLIFPSQIDLIFWRSKLKMCKIISFVHFFSSLISSSVDFYKDFLKELCCHQMIRPVNRRFRRKDAPARYPTSGTFSTLATSRTFVQPVNYKIVFSKNLFKRNLADLTCFFEFLKVISDR